MTNTLVIDTSYGSTVGVVGHEPVVERDSRTHVERLQVDIADAIEEAGLHSSDIERIVVGIGPAPFTGLRAGIVTAKALAFSTGAELLGQDALSAQASMMAAYHRGEFPFPESVGVARISEASGVRDETTESPAKPTAVSHVTLAVNDARRKQLYFTLIADADDASSGQSHGNGYGNHKVLIDMDIDYPQRIAERVNAAIAQHDSLSGTHTVVDVVGHGAAKYAESWSTLSQLGVVLDASVLDMGSQGLTWYAEHAHANRGMTQAGSDGNADGGALADSYTNNRAISPTDAIEPLYLRRPDVSVPSPLKHVLHHAGADRAE
ncbi:MAG: tRNA (adenosine(37)-N6)-threonylcarbamoyltransferase complex dimerization subunit type 1 TsaB [Bifidobacterium subtile]|jgi:tRNA threonylcarbamoyl adenosine modification protein YeaZ|nr:tRNA (adenosine(37)-N6)-threonylcarbamoyltransferase complex dimerization subunit type 1 TsaB [Bifidobacterium subtile]MCI1241020.1 tRNA (adenosine(37)-N6)-threonylcarbamoyltransferase complex dimerization subunit type 1 TsaB [Bifidobacterium subtile]MCI1257884.1 tRNA (adenosine(37)-N6)-threonylcarbamoyltransferase complex dimerization subunit type 1 TsaB [Bifidobacterium subtile]